MSGVVAVIDVGRRRTVAEDDLSSLITAYESLRGPVRREELAAGSFARVAHLGSPTRHHANSSASGFVSVGVPHAVDASAVTRDTPPSMLDGQFAMISYDPLADELRLVTDPFGMVPMYVAERDGRAYVSTCSLALAVLLKTPADLLSVQSFLVTGTHFGSGTHWKGVQRLLPATCVTFSHRGRRDATYWRPVVDAEVQKLSLTQAADLAIDVSVDTVSRHLRGREQIWTDLTEGFDSRLLNLLCDRARLPFRAQTRDSMDGADAAAAQRISELTGWPWMHVRLPAEWPSMLPLALDRALAWGDANLEALQLARVLWAHQQLGTEGGAPPTLLSGGGGEHFQYYSWKTEFLRAGRSHSVNWDNYLSMRMIKPADRTVLSGEATAAVRAGFHERLAAWVQPYAGESNTTQLDVLHALKSTGHYGAYRSASDGSLVTELPYYYRAVFETAFSIDYRHRNFHRLMRLMVHRLNPRVAALPTTQGGPAQPLRLTNLHRYGPYGANLVRTAITKTSDKVLGRPLLLKRSSYDWQAEAHREVFGELERRGLLPVRKMRSIQLYRPDRLETMLAEAVGPGFKEQSMLGRILTVELALHAADVGIES